MQLRAGYFGPDSNIFYGSYFSRLGNCLRAQWFTKTKNARDVFQKYVFKSDCLPWLSKDASYIDLLKAAASDDQAIVLHRKFLSKTLLALRPRWVQVNGIGQSECVAALFANVQLKPRVCMEPAGRIQVGWADICEDASTFRVPVLVHKFMNWLSKDGFRIAATEFERFVNEPRRFEFSEVH